MKNQTTKWILLNREERDNWIAERDGCNIQYEIHFKKYDDGENRMHTLVDEENNKIHCLWMQVETEDSHNVQIKLKAEAIAAAIAKEGIDEYYLCIRKPYVNNDGIIKTSFVEVSKNFTVEQLAECFEKEPILLAKSDDLLESMIQNNDLKTY
jgi:hypothetical protein